jgi:phosphoglycolate phosphatase-like HAD superfamily hydrolase
VARDDAPPKPDPEAVFAACRILGVDPKACVMVGDYTFDIQAGKNAGCRTIFIETDKFRHLDPGSDARIKSLEELAGILEKWLDE